MNEPGNGGALAGVKVVDLTRVLGGPYGTQILGDHGAEIIKVEPPQGDEVRDWGPPFHDGDASYFIGVNRNKRSIGLDLGTEAGREVLMRLLADADVLIENYKTGSMEKWGLGYEDVLRERFPRLIHCRISGFGASGPLGGLPGYDAIVQAMTGMFSINGEKDSGQTRIGIPLVDLGTGLYCVIAILMALVERARSGQGQYLDMSLYDCGIALMHPHTANFFLSGRVPGLTGNAHPNIAPYDKYKTKTVEIFVAAGNERAFRRMCEMLGKPELAEDPRFKTNADRLANRPELDQELGALLAEHDGDELCDRLMAIGVPAGPVWNTEQVMTHPQTAERGMAVAEDWYRGAGTPVKLTRTPGGMQRVPPRFGEHARQVLAENGFTADEIDGLIASGVVLEQRRR